MVSVTSRAPLSGTGDTSSRFLDHKLHPEWQGETCPLVYECQVVHWNDLQPDALLPDIRDRAYPRDDFHRLYYGQITGVFAAGE